MKELESILICHARRYPHMQPEDAVKLIYQNEFGGGHLIRDEEACLEYLRGEYASIQKDDAVPLYEDIGNGIVRVNLAAVDEPELERLGQAFIRSAAERQGAVSAFRKKLAVLRRVTGTGIFSFSAKQLEDYLAQYEAAGFPPVSHSRIYREVYHPAYRVVLKSVYPNENQPLRE